MTMPVQTRTMGGGVFGPPAPPRGIIPYGQGPIQPYGRGGAISPYGRGGAIVPWSAPPAGRAGVRGVAGAATRGFGGRFGDFLSTRFNLFGKSTSFGRAGLAGGLGLLAIRNGANMMDRMRYGDYGGAMLSGAMTAAAGYGAYAAWMYKGSIRSHLGQAAAQLMKNVRRI